MNNKPTFLISSMRPFGALGRAAISWVDHLGASSIFLFLAFMKIVRPNQLIKIVQQIFYIGARSTMILMLVSSRTWCWVFNPNHL